MRIPSIALSQNIRLLFGRREYSGRFVCLATSLTAEIVIPDDASDYEEANVRVVAFLNAIYPIQPTAK